MSTRANILVKGYKESLWFYRHSNGYPEGAMPILNTFMNYVAEGRIRNNPSQAAGWLILLGAKEYGQEYWCTMEKIWKKGNVFEPGLNNSGWKVGAIEPTTAQHGDIEYLYELDLKKNQLKCYKIDYNYKTKKTIKTIQFTKVYPLKDTDEDTVSNEDG
jgi:hypothetical protein